MINIPARVSAASPPNGSITSSPMSSMQHEEISTQVKEACARIPPLWPLKNFVAVNPFIGLTDKHFIDTCALMRRVTPGDIFMPAAYYQQRLDTGEIGSADLQNALEQAQQTLPNEYKAVLAGLTPSSLKQTLSNQSKIPNASSASSAILTVADSLDDLYDTHWVAFIVDEISKWCSAYYDEGQASWRMPWRGGPLFGAWKQAARYDANSEMMGLRAFRAFVAALPDEAMAAIKYSLNILRVPDSAMTDFLHRQLMSISGWSGYVQYQVREKRMKGKSDDSLQHLLAIRLAYEAALYQQYNTPNFVERWTHTMASGQSAITDVASFEVLTSYLWQLAAENAYQRRLLASLGGRLTSESPAMIRPALQAVFCIDVRSEVLRRSLEAQSPQVETIGFAGFFGFPIEYVAFGQRNGQAQCPVLITPSFRIRESLPDGSHQQVEKALRNKFFAQRLRHAWSAFKTSAVSCFSFVETSGMLSGLKLVKDSLGGNHDVHVADMAPMVQRETTPHKQHGHDHPHLHDSGMSVDEQIAVAANALKNMGLTTTLARLVVFCGHGSSTTNNPYGSGLDCGACGGHSGEVNARVAAAVLNHPPVREGLRTHGIYIPEDTVFLAALHNTTTDDITIFDAASVPTTHTEDLYHLQRWLEAASRETRVQRAPLLGLVNVPAAQIDKQVRARSRDWAQTRPEWGLAGNAAFIAAPRERTQGLNLSGRTFLNNYDYHSDIDRSKLELIMTAPMIVASWINLQYFASTVNNQQFGSGNKTIHNVVGTIGVWQGNSGDLQVGLPLQSVHDGHRWMHEPLRLSVLIEAPRTMIDEVIRAHESVRELFNNGWLHLIAIEDGGQRFARYYGNLQWKSIEDFPV